MGWVPAYFNASVDPADRFLQSQLRQKVIPLSYSPFDPVQDDPNFDELTLPETVVEEEEVEGVEAVPEWLELFFDLAWTITFSGLSANTPIKGAMTVVSYLCFFVLAWWLWIAQVLYDTKFYINDWWHRVFLLLQFILFGALSAFTEGFDVTVGFKTIDQSDAGDAADATYVKRAFLAISLVFFASRVLLAIEYSRIIRLARHRKLSNLYILVGTLSASAILFLGSFFVTRANPDSGGSNALKFIMWGLAIGIEVLAYFYTSMPRGLIRSGSMPNRLSTLTTVVIGEGLNGLIDPVVSAAKSVGFNGKVAAQVLVTAAFVFLIFIIYFQSFRPRQAPTSLRQKLVVMVHFPVQLFIILLLEGMKSILNITTLLNSLEFFILKVVSSTGDLLDPAPDIISAYQQIGLSLPELNQKLFNRTGNISPELSQNITSSAMNVTLDDFADREYMLRVLAAAFQALFNTFKVLDDKQNDKFSSYINDDNQNGLAVNDTIWMYQNPDPDSVFPPPTLAGFLDDSAGDRFAPSTWIAGIAGGFLLSLALIMAFNGLHRNRYEWYSLLSRIIGGLGVAVFAFVDVNETALENWVTTGWFLPTIVLCYFVLYVVDYVIAVAAARALHREQLQARYQPTLNPSDSGSRLKISHPIQTHEKYE